MTISYVLIIFDAAEAHSNFNFGQDENDRLLIILEGTESLFAFTFQRGKIRNAQLDPDESR